jgi:hypothetical protein
MFGLKRVEYAVLISKVITSLRTSPLEPSDPRLKNSQIRPLSDEEKIALPPTVYRYSTAQLSTSHIVGPVSLIPILISIFP